jgi:hypothetical protein
VPIILVLFFASFTHSLTGFGFALIAVPLTIELLGAQTAAPLVAVASITSEIILLIRYRHAINFRALGRLSVASVIAIPLGVALLQAFDERVMLTLLGLFIMGYALYSLFNMRLPHIQHPRWAYGFGFASGLLSGAYNIGGPPVVIYGSCRRWTPVEFKSNLQGFFLINSITVITTHMLAQHFTPVVWQNYVLALPGIALGLILGLSFDRFIKPEVFRKLVLVLLIVLGLNLIF